MSRASRLSNECWQRSSRRERRNASHGEAGPDSGEVIREMAWRLFQRRRKAAEKPPEKPAAVRLRRESQNDKPAIAVSPEILRQVKLLELRTRGLVNSLFTGEYRSVF